VHLDVKHGSLFIGDYYWLEITTLTTCSLLSRIKKYQKYTDSDVPESKPEMPMCVYVRAPDASEERQAMCSENVRKAMIRTIQC
jgi:hypothetical protein